MLSRRRSRQNPERRTMNNDITSGGPLIKKATGKLATVEQQIAVSTGLPDGKQPRSQGDEDFASLLAPQSDAVAADSPAQIGLANGAKQKKIDTNFEQEDGVMPPLPPDEPEVLDTIPSTGNSRLHTLSKDTLEFAGVDGTSKKNNTSEQLFTLIAPKETTLVDHRFRKTDTHSDLPNQLAKVGSESGTQTSCHPEILPTQIRAADSARNSLQSVATQARDSGRSNIPLASAQQLQTTTASSTSLTNNSAQVASARTFTLQPTDVKGKDQVHANGATLIKDANTATPASKIDQQTTPPVDAQSRPSPPAHRNSLLPRTNRPLQPMLLI